MAQDVDKLLSDAKAASAHADETEAMHKVSPTPVPEGLKSVASAPAKSDYSLVHNLRTHKEDVDKALKLSQ